MDSAALQCFFCGCRLVRLLAKHPHSMYKNPKKTKKTRELGITMSIFLEETLQFIETLTKKKKKQTS